MVAGGGAFLDGGYGGDGTIKDFHFPIKSLYEFLNLDEYLFLLF